MNFTIECIIYGYLQWGLKLGIKNLLVFPLGKFKSTDIEVDQIPESPSGSYWIIFFNFSEFSLCYELFKCPTWIIECPTDTGTFQGQKGPLQSLSLIYFLMQFIVTPLSSHRSYQSFPLCSHTNAQQILLHTPVPWFPGNHIWPQMRCSLPISFGFLFHVTEHDSLLIPYFLNPESHTCFPSLTNSSDSEVTVD